MSLKAYLLILCVAGVLLPLSQFAPWLFEHGLNTQLFIEELFSTRIGGFFGFDVIVSAVVLFVFVLSEGKRLNMTKLWFPIVATLGVGVSFGLPLFLYMREKQIESQTNKTVFS